MLINTEPKERKKKSKTMNKTFKNWSDSSSCVPTIHFANVTIFQRTSLHGHHSPPHHRTILIPLCFWSDGGCCCCVVPFVRQMWWQWKLKLFFSFSCCWCSRCVSCSLAFIHFSCSDNEKCVVVRLIKKTTDKFPFWEHKNCFWSQWRCTLYKSEINTYGMDLECSNKDKVATTSSWKLSSVAGIRSCEMEKRQRIGRQLHSTRYEYIYCQTISIKPHGECSAATM